VIGACVGGVRGRKEKKGEETYDTKNFFHHQAQEVKLVTSFSNLGGGQGRRERGQRERLRGVRLLLAQQTRGGHFWEEEGGRNLPDPTVVLFVTAMGKKLLPGKWEKGKGESREEGGVSDTKRGETLLYI